MKTIQDLFSERGFSPAPDEELVSLLSKGAEYMTLTQLGSYINRVKRLDKQPVTVMYDDGNKVVYWHRLRKDFKAALELLKTAKEAGLEKKESIRFLYTTVDSYKYNHGSMSNHITAVKDILQEYVDRGKDFKTEFKELEDFLIELPKKMDGDRAIVIVQKCAATGMSLKQSIGVVNHIYENSGSFCGYVFGSLFEELQLLGPNNVHPDYIYHSLLALLGDDPTMRQGYFSVFTQMLYHAVTDTPYSQSDILGAVSGQKVLNGQPVTYIAESASAEEDMFTKTMQVLELDKNNGHKKPVDDYFPEIGIKKLKHGILPYRAGRDLQSGLSDLKEYAMEEYMEGAWIFDKGSDTWFSLGGRSEVIPGGFRHTCAVYDVAALSSAPVFVHIHPKRCENLVAPPSDSMVYPEMREKLTKYISSMPSTTDFKFISTLLEMSSQPVQISTLIVNSTGVTEIRVPNDHERVAEFAKTFRKVCDSAMLEFDVQGYLNHAPENDSDINFVRKVLVDLNEKLPDGFEILIHEHDKKIDLGNDSLVATSLLGGKQWTKSLGDRGGRFIE